MIPDGKHDSSVYEIHGTPFSGTDVLSIIDRLADDISPMDIGVVICDGLDVIHYTNQAFEYIYEYNINEAIGKDINIIFPSGETPHKLYGTLNGEYDTVTKTGIGLKTIISTSLLGASDSGMRILFFRDKTRRTQAEGALAKTEMKNQALLDAIPDLMFIVKKDGTFLDYKVEDLSQLSVPPQQLIGKKANEALPLEIAERFVSTVDMAIETGLIQYFNYKIQMRDGIHYFEARCVSMSGDEALIIARDFTQRHRSEESLKLTQFTMDESKDMIFWTSLDSHFIYVNESACKTLGYAKEELLSLKILDILDQLSDSSLNKYIAYIKALKANEDHTFESVARRKDGAHIPVEITANYLNHKGREYICAFVRDITERKHAEEARSLLALIVESSDDAIIGESLDGRITSWNRGAERLYCYTAEEAIGSPLTLIMPKDRPNDAYEVLERVKRGEKVQHYETERLNKNGELIIVSLTLSPIFDSAGMIIGASAIARDITDSKRAEMKLLSKNSELAALNAKLRELSRAVEQSGSTVVITDINGNIEYVNPKFVALTGYSAEEAIGKNPRILKSGETPREVYEKLWKAITSGKEWHGEFHNKKKNGELYWEYATISPITDSDGKITNFMAVKEDITEQKQANEAIRVKNRDLGILNSIASTINGTARIEDKLGLVLKDVLLLADMDAGAIYLGDAGSSGAMSLMSFEYRSLVGKAVTCRPRISGKVPGEKVCYYDQDASYRPDVFENVRTSIVVPLLIKNKPVGLMALYGSKAARQDKCSELINIGSQLSIAIENHHLFKNVQETSKYLAGIINEAPDAMLTADGDGKILSFNKSARSLLQYSAREIKGKKISSLLLNGDVDLSTVKSDVMGFRAKDGTTKQLNVSISRINKSDANSGYIITLKDLSKIRGLKITPITEKAMDTVQKYTLESGMIYLFDRRGEQDYLDIFADQVRHNVQGLCVTRQSPARIRQRLGLEKTPMIWLNASDGIAGENCIKPDNLTGLGATLSKFLGEAKNGFILIDGIEYLIARNSFETVLKFIHFLNDKTMTSRCSILIVLDPLSIAEQQYHLLTSEIKLFKKESISGGQ